MSRPVTSRQRFAQVLATAWLDPSFVALDTDARLLFLWSFTQPRASACGLYVATVPELRGALSRYVPGPEPRPEWEAWMDLRLTGALEQLGEKPMLLYDDEASVLWVVNRARHANTSERAQKLMRAEYLTVPPSRLRDLFFASYASMLQLPGDDTAQSVRGGR